MSISAQAASVDSPSQDKSFEDGGSAAQSQATTLNPFRNIMFSSRFREEVHEQYLFRRPFPKLGIVELKDINRNVVPVTLDWLPVRTSATDLARFVSLERNSWANKSGIYIPESIITQRAHENPVIIARVGGQIIGAISFITMNLYSLDDIPRSYDSLAAFHNSDGDSLIDYSVVVDEGFRPRVRGLAKALVAATFQAAEALGKKQVLAYSRADPLRPHIRFNPRFFSHALSDAQMMEEALATFRNLYPEPSMADYTNFFRVSMTEKSLREYQASHKRALNGADFTPDISDLKKYFALAGWPRTADRTRIKEARFLDFMNFYLTKIADPFLCSTHLGMGAKVVKVISNSRPEDIRGGMMNVVVKHKFGRPENT